MVYVVKYIKVLVSVLGKALLYESQRPKTADKETGLKAKIVENHDCLWEMKRRTSSVLLNRRCMYRESG